MALYDKLEDTDEQILAGKKALADALLQVGITAVEPNPNNPDSYETFQSYADKIKRLMISNSLILEYTIPSEGFENLTKYKRTVFLPMSRIIADDIIKSIINSDTGYTPSSATISTLSTLDNDNAAHSVTDHFGNIVADNNNPAPMSDLDKFLMSNPEGAAEYLHPENRPEPMALSDNYAFTVDWGDGTVVDFVDYDTTPEAWYHTYEQSGTYDVSINGIFALIYNYTNWYGNILNDNGSYFLDKDGEQVYSEFNYAGMHYLRKVIAWGNTQLRSLDYAFIRSLNLESIPTYDTTFSFERLTSADSMLYACSSIKALPYDSGAQRGIFSNSPELLNCSFTFDGISATEELPPLILDKCPKIVTVAGIFSSADISGSLPAAMFDGLSGLTDANRAFYDCRNISGEIPQQLFASCPNLKSTYLFTHFSSISGTAPAGLYAPVAKQHRATCAFARTTLTSVDPDFYSGTTSGFSGTSLFSNCVITDVDLTIFDHCYDQYPARLFAVNTSMTGVTGDGFMRKLSDRGVVDAQCMFAYCPRITTALPWENLGSYDKMLPFIGLYAMNTSAANYNEIPAELGGDGPRLYPQYHAGQILLSDMTFVEPKDYAYSASNPPVGVCFHSNDNEHLISALNSFYAAMTASQYLSTTLWSQINFLPTTMSLADTHSESTGEASTRAFLAWDEYQSNPDNFPAIKRIAEYSPNEHLFWYVPDYSDYWLLSMTREIVWKATTAIINAGEGGFTSSNCYPIPYSSSNYHILRKIGSQSNYFYTTLYFGYSNGSAHGSRYIRPISKVNYPFLKEGASRVSPRSSCFGDRT